jgi:hypothetical protein
MKKESRQRERRHSGLNQKTPSGFWLCIICGEQVDDKGQCHNADCPLAQTGLPQ